MGQKLRVSVAPSDKRAALLAARRLRVAIETAGGRILHGERVKLNSAIYLDVEVDRDDQVPTTIDGVAVTVERDVAPRAVDECLNCGNVADAPHVVCPNCGFRETAACPNCHHDIARSDYEQVEGTLYRCPNCATRVHLTYNDPLLRDDGRYNEPIVLVTLALPREERRAS